MPTSRSIVVCKRRRPCAACLRRLARCPSDGSPRAFSLCIPERTGRIPYNRRHDRRRLHAHGHRRGAPRRTARRGSHRRRRRIRAHRSGHAAFVGEAAGHRTGMQPARDNEGSGGTCGVPCDEARRRSAGRVAADRLHRVRDAGAVRHVRGPHAPGARSPVRVRRGGSESRRARHAVRGERGQAAQPHVRSGPRRAWRRVRAYAARLLLAQTCEEVAEAGGERHGE